ncbi:MAG: His/Gly/Thr/Pro-type tRNA ligase C-terminal domain-containing protein, partial [Gemmataceae bacterium]
APFGSLERFTGILIENFAGAFPLWLAPEQIRVLTISEKSQEYGQKLETSLKTAGLRTSGDYRAEKIGSKIREAQLEKIPYMAIVGEKDLQNGTVSLRHRTQGELGAIPQADLLPKLLEEIRTKTIV